MEKITDKTLVSTTELAVIFGWSARRVQQLTQDGVFIPEKRGRYNLKEAVAAYVEYINSGKEDSNIEIAKIKKAMQDARLKEAKADIEELRAKELKGEMHRSEDVAAITEDMIYSIRSALIAFPGRVAIDAHACGSAAEVADVLTKEIHKVMRELAEYHYDPARYEERVREREKWNLDTMDEETEGEG